MLKKDYVRDGNRKIIGSVTSGYSGGTSDVVRDEHNEIAGRTSDRFRTTRDGRGESRLHHHERSGASDQP